MGSYVGEVGLLGTAVGRSEGELRMRGISVGDMYREVNMDGDTVFGVEVWTMILAGSSELL